ncbi:MAG TPA: 3-phosphoshikimate 1-carboxyvinyltransferase [Candidatus Saccharimonadales bacterium]|nr:3-phosphoshikimate 1-carboxyvinyltransferase [Candidatus Saccharimonadales bacterium]
MSLPDLIEICPVQSVPRALVTVPGSKSITNRALVLAALAEGEVVLQGALWSEDTQVMVDCLQTLGYMVNVAEDSADACNRTISVYGMGGKVPRGGTEENPIELFVGNAGTAARFLSAMVCLGEGVYRLTGIPRMHQRPQAALFRALRVLGYRIESVNDKLPALIHGGGRRFATCQVTIAESSQFASALLLCAAHGGWNVQVTGENAEESPYVAMTLELREAFPRRGGTFQIEPDASSGSYFWGANHLLAPDVKSILVNHWPTSGWQIDAEFPKFLPLPKTVSRQEDLGDSIMTAIALAPFGNHAVLFKDLGRLRVQECERVEALRTELSKCGAKVLEQGDTLEVFPSALHGAEIETYNDHRMAMCFAILGLKVSGITLKNPSCVKKTFPNFYQKLAEPAPRGIGARILDGRTGRPLISSELFAE